MFFPRPPTRAEYQVLAVASCVLFIAAGAASVVVGVMALPDKEQLGHSAICYGAASVGVGVVCLVIGFIGIFFGGGDAVGQVSLIAGGILVVTSLFAFRGFRIRVQRDREDRDIRKLYGTPKV